jgi:hypothetical protein
MRRVTRATVQALLAATVTMVALAGCGTFTPPAKVRFDLDDNGVAKASPKPASTHGASSVTLTVTVVAPKKFTGASVSIRRVGENHGVHAINDRTCRASKHDTCKAVTNYTSLGVGNYEIYVKLPGKEDKPADGVIQVG